MAEILVYSILCRLYPAKRLRIGSGEGGGSAGGSLLSIYSPCALEGAYSSGSRRCLFKFIHTKAASFCNLNKVTLGGRAAALPGTYKYSINVVCY